MVTDSYLATLQMGIYGLATVGWDYHSAPDAKVVWGAKVAPDGVTDLIFRGSSEEIDWLRDFDFIALPLDHGKLGPVHAGFFMDMESVLLEVQHNTKAPRRVGGHSLGAGRATDLTALLVQAGEAPLQRVVWGEPLSGCAEQCAIVSKVPARSYRNTVGSSHDPVTDAPPFTLTFHHYQRACALTNVCQPPVDPNWHGLGLNNALALHNMALYAMAMQRMWN